MAPHPVRCMVALVATLSLSCDESLAPVVVTVQVPPDLQVAGVQVSARAEPDGVERPTGCITLDGHEPQVAMYPGDLLGTGEITLSAKGFSDEGCSAWAAYSDPLTTPFRPWVRRENLPLKACDESCADGGTRDGGMTCGAGLDAGDACDGGVACASDGVCVPGFLYPPSNFNPNDITN